MKFKNKNSLSYFIASLECFISKVENTVKLYISMNSISFIVSVWLVLAASTAALSHVSLI